MKVIGYETKKAHTTDIVRSALKSFNGDLLPIEKFLDGGLANADLVIISGILRGSGLVYKECIKQRRDFLFIDHAYFHKGYEHPTWMRVTKNRHVFGPKLLNKDPDRFQSHFAGRYALQSWRGPGTGPIVILPPTHAISWLFDAHDWQTETIKRIRQLTDHPIKIRAKPEDPIVDERGFLVRMDKNASADVPLQEDILNAKAVIAYNSNSVIECVRLGVPVICSENCAAFPISHALSDIIDQSRLSTEPKRQDLFNDLAYHQLTKHEMERGSILPDLALR